MLRCVACLIGLLFFAEGASAQALITDPECLKILGIVANPNATAQIREAMHELAHNQGCLSGAPSTPAPVKRVFEDSACFDLPRRMADPTITWNQIQRYSAIAHKNACDETPTMEHRNVSPSTQDELLNIVFCRTVAALLAAHQDRESLQSAAKLALENHCDTVNY